MKCCICGQEIDGYGNNPYPFCANNDNESRCCNECNNQAIDARIIKEKALDRQVKENDLVVIFWSNASDSPIRTLNENKKFLAGYATDNEALPDGCWEGSWGNFILNTKTDSFAIVDIK